MFKYISYNLRTGTLTATNNYTTWYCGDSNVPQEAKYFSSMEEALQWIDNHPKAHEEFLKELEDFYTYTNRQDSEMSVQQINEMIYDTKFDYNAELQEYLEEYYNV